MDLKFHPDNCETVSITIPTPCILRGQGLRNVSKTKYVGVTIASNLKWNTHKNTVKKANKTLGFLKRNLKGASEEVREMAYKTIVHPQTEYCDAIWDPYTKVLTNKIKITVCRFLVS